VLRAQVVVTVAYRVPVLALLGASFSWAPFTASLLLLVGAFALLSDLFDLIGFPLRIGAFVGASVLGAPLWLVLTIAGVSTAYRKVVTSSGYAYARWFPRRVDPQVRLADCSHMHGASAQIRAHVQSGHWSDALDVSLMSLASHPRQRTDCLAELALMTAEIAAVATAPEIATLSAKAARRLADSQSGAHRAIDVRSNVAEARAEAQQGNIERARSAAERAARSAAGIRNLERQVSAVSCGISALTERGDPDINKLVPAAAQALGIRSDALDAALLDYADWFRLNGRPRESLELYWLARSATEFDRFINDLGSLPKVLGVRWSLRGRLWARAVSGQLQARLIIEDRPSESLRASADSAATVLLRLGEWPAFVELRAAVCEADSKHDAHGASNAVLREVEAAHTRHRYVVIDWAARGNWERAVQRARAARARTPSEVPQSANAVAADSTWLAGEGTAVSRAGVDLAAALDDLLQGAHVTALRAMSMRLGTLGLKEEALNAAEAVVQIQRSKDTNHSLSSLGFPLWRLGICREEVGQRVEGLDTHLESLEYFRRAALRNESDRLTCAQVVRDCVQRLIDAERFEQALPLALETIRRFAELTPSETPSQSTSDAAQKLAEVYERLDRFDVSAETHLKLARAWEASKGDPNVRHAWAAESYWRASRVWRRVKRVPEEREALALSQVHLSAIDDLGYSLEWQIRRRHRVGAALGKLLMDQDASYSDALRPLREALDNLRKLPASEAHLHEDLRGLLLRLAACTERVDPTAQEEVLALRREAFDESLEIERDAESDWVDYVDDSAYWLAITYLRTGQPAKVLAVADTVRALTPPLAPSALWLRYTTYLAATAVGDSSRADEEIRAAIAIANADSDGDATALSVFTRCVLFIAAGDDTRAMSYIKAAMLDGNAPSSEQRELLWADLADLERTIGPRSIVDEIRELLPLVESGAH
jgi:tetratricopeptide (TPR) repeat protein